LQAGIDRGHCPLSVSPSRYAHGRRLSGGCEDCRQSHSRRVLTCCNLLGSK
jgi:hypothetical protein